MTAWPLPFASASKPRDEEAPAATTRVHAPPSPLPRSSNPPPQLAAMLVSLLAYLCLGVLRFFFSRLQTSRRRSTRGDYACVRAPPPRPCSPTPLPNPAALTPLPVPLLAHLCLGVLRFDPVLRVRLPDSVGSVYCGFSFTMLIPLYLTSPQPFFMRAFSASYAYTFSPMLCF